MSEVELVKRLRAFDYEPTTPGAKRVKALLVPLKDLNDAADTITRLVKERDEANARSESRGRILLRTRDKLVNIKDKVISEEDRVFFGSTNDADEFIEVVDALDNFKWDRIMREGKEDTPLKDARARAEAAEAQVAALTKALEKIGELDHERVTKEVYRNDGAHSKMDKCDHGRRMYEDCDECTAAFARKALEASR